MDNFEMENITVRKPPRSNSMDNILNTNLSSNSTLLDTTMMSLPNNSLNDSDAIASYRDTIKKLTIELQSAHHEIENLNSENFRLKLDIGQYQKVIETYKRVNFLETKRFSPKSARKENLLRASCFSTPTKLNLPPTITHQPNTAVVTQTPSDIGNISFNTAGSICSSEGMRQAKSPSNTIQNSTTCIDKIDQDTRNKETSSTLDTDLKKGFMETTSERQSNLSPQRSTQPQTRTQTSATQNVMIFADQSGYDVRKILQDYLGKRFAVTSFVKPNATTKEVLKTCASVTSLRDVMLLVQPSTVIRGGTAALICSRDMQGAPLYSVKWYRGNHEFYRYTPMEEPDTRVFGLPGIYVDMNRSNGTQVLLRRLDLTLAGNFSCEVTADSPSFATQIATKFIDVVALPPTAPVLLADKDRYQPGEVLQANCTSAPARPAANLTIYINEEPLRSSETSLHPYESGLLWTSVKADIKVTPELFVGGRLRVACLCTIYDVYRKSANLDFFTPDTDPRPERITHNSASKCFQSWILLFLLFLLPVVMGQDSLIIIEDYVDYDSRLNPASLASLVGG